MRWKFIKGLTLQEMSGEFKIISGEDDFYTDFQIFEILSIYLF